MSIIARALINCAHTVCVQLVKPSRLKRPVTVNDCFLLHLSLKVHQVYFIFHVAMNLYNIKIIHSLFVSSIYTYSYRHPTQVILRLTVILCGSKVRRTTQSTIV